MAKRRRPVDVPEDVLRTARDRIKHVVVLMLENRSFDHMLGFLAHPRGAAFPGLADGQFPNPADIDDPRDPSPAEPVHPTADYVLAVDPPHGHASVKLAVDGTGWRRFRMDGFVTAYRQKLAGHEKIAFIRWDRLLGLGVVVALLLAAAVQNLCHLATAGGWPRAWLLVAAGEFVLFAAILGIRAAVSLTERTREVVVGTAVFGLVLAAALQAAYHRMYHQWLGFAWTFAFLAAVIVALLLQAKASRAQKPYVPTAALDREARKVMHCMAPGKVPVLAGLAREFAVCTRWHSSVPGATWPNRQFLLSGTSAGTVDIEVGVYTDETVFDRLGDDCWRIYHDGMAQAMCYPSLWEHGREGNWYPMSDFYDDVAAGGRGLRELTFIEPSHEGPASNSQHPGNNRHVTAGSTDFERGEVLMWRIYEALRANPALFEETLLLITYDENGGLFDHEPPPRAVPPGRGTRKERAVHFTRRLIGFFVENDRGAFDFRSLGVRVPAILVSPWVETAALDTTTVYDHTSLIPSLFSLFPRPGEPLSDRAAVASPFLHLVAARPQARSPMPTLTEPPLAADVAATEAAVAVEAVAAVAVAASPAAVPAPAVPTPAEPMTKVTVGADLRNQLQALDRIIRPKVAADVPAEVAARRPSTADLFMERSARSRGEG